MPNRLREGWLYHDNGLRDRSGPAGARATRDVVRVTESTRQGDRPSIGELVSTLSEKLSALIRDEIRLAKAEMAEKARNAGIGIGLFVGAGVFAFFGFAVLIATAVLGLAEAMPAWLAALDRKSVV